MYFAFEVAPEGQKPYEINLRVGGYRSVNMALRILKSRQCDGMITDERRQIVLIYRRGKITYDRGLS